MFAPTFNYTSGIPGLELAELISYSVQFVFAMLRVGSFILAAPFFAARYINLQVRIMMAVALTIPVITQVEMPPVDVLVSMKAVPMILSEIALGLAAGLVLSIIFGTAAVAGDRIAATAGLGFAAQIDPASGTSVPVISQLFSLFMLATFVSLDGHLLALRMMIESYNYIPPGGPLLTGPMLEAGKEAARDMFTYSVQLMMPVVSILLLVNVLIGVITRSAPQMNIFSFGFPMTLTMTVVLLFVGAPVLGKANEWVMGSALDLLDHMLQEMANGRR
ncbi:flagellar biosynthetic protein FliR [Donghicola sp. C2-DW-16]|uniref:Flagellar biosynthetic protein FliR n=1 Tax=Donghicola mangrovi TaxID=2729614 RepID=A0A850Q2C2_9RHOB|nr:flagellar biosynthetic protein FliR [Donghicola mangrovi]NVO22082.1 flagellar biosynthetic protein FliR [Donghicola mangrovi]NVO26327.1 flagellar biosynthetic protein FliR [Donghicola mangrovi]